MRRYPPKSSGLYEDAIRSAHANGFVQNEATAYERASVFYRGCGLDTSADLYLRGVRLDGLDHA